MRWPGFFRQNHRDAIWRGVYSRFEDVPRHGPGFSGDGWQKTLGNDVRLAIEGRSGESVVIEHEVLLLLVHSLTPAKVQIVDFGGGYGPSFFYLRRAVPSLDLRYDVVEVPSVVAGARATLSDGRLTFGADLERRHHRPDVVFVKSALQYVADYRSAIQSLLALEATFVLLENFSGVDCESYVSAQLNVRGSSIPYWFISIREVIDIARAAGYDIVLRRKLNRHYDQSGFIEQLRMGHASTLLFQRGAISS